MTKADLVDKLAETTGFTKTDLAFIVDELIDTIKESVIKGETLQIRRFGTFSVKERKSRAARNPRTGEEVQVPRRYVPTFKVSDVFKEELNAPKFYDKLD